MKTTRKKQQAYIKPPIPKEALAWPSEPDPTPVDVRQWLEGKPYGTLFAGWWMNKYFDSMGSVHSRVGQGCSSGYSHSTYSTTKTSSQNCGVFYATKKDAVLALRWAWCRMFATALHQASNINIEEE